MEGLNAKERRKLLRAAKRGEEHNETIEVRPRGAVTSVVLGNAKERRKEARALKRAESSTKSDKEVSAENAKARRKAKRAAEREASKKVPPLVAFVGQLSYTTSAERLKQFFIDHGVSGKLRVRLRTDKKSGKSLGQAFVQCETTTALHECIALHHATIDNRRINVEKSAGGGKSVKQQRLDQMRSDQQKHVQATVKRILDQYLADGRLKPTEIDEGVQSLLERRSGKLATLALEEFCTTEDRDTLDNPAAFLTAIVTRLSSFEEAKHEEATQDVLDPKSHSRKRTLDSDDSRILPPPILIEGADLRPHKRDITHDKKIASQKKQKVTTSMSASSPDPKTICNATEIKRDEQQQQQHNLAEIFPALRGLHSQ